MSEFIIVIVAIFLGAVIGVGYERSRMQTKAVEHQCAEYDTSTGEWRWKADD